VKNAKRLAGFMTKKISGWKPCWNCRKSIPPNLQAVNTSVY